MTRVEVMPGICGFLATISADYNEDEELTLTVDTGCASCSKLAEMLNDELDDLEPFDIVLTKPALGPVYQAASKCLPHAACPVPSAIIRCIEAECKLALPKDSYIRFL